MGNEYIQQDVQLFYSKAPQVAVNTPKSLGADFGTALVDAFPAIIPQAETVDDSDQVGDGSEFPRFVRLYRWGLSFGLGMRLNTELALILMSRALGGDITNTVVTAALVWDHLTIMQKRNQGRIPKATTFILPNTGGANFLFADMFVEGFTVTQNGDAQPTVQFQLMGTGLHIKPHGVTGLPDPVTATPEHHYFHGAALGFVLNDGSLKDIGASGRVLSYTFDYKNNIQISRRVGDLFIVAGNIRSGAYAKNVIHGRRTANLQYKGTLGDTLDEYDWLRNTTAITGISLTNKGDIIETTNRFELELKIPAAQLQSAAGSQDNNFLSVDDGLLALKDTVTEGLITVRGRNGVATLT